MELWIRSQDETKLIKSNYLSLFLSDTNWYIYSDTNTGEPFNIGIYKTKERALEILDEIENILMPKIKVVHNKVERKDLDGFRAEYIMQPMIEDVQVLEASSYVYKMPKE